MINDIYIYQIGVGDGNCHLFNKGGLEARFYGGVKTNKSKNPQGDGDIDARSGMRDYKDGIGVKVKYHLKQIIDGANVVFNNNDVRILDKIYNDGPFPVIFYRELVDGDIEFLYNIGKVMTPPSKSTLAMNEGGEQIRIYEVDISMLIPYFLRINNNDIQYLDILDYKSKVKYWGQPGLVWGSAGTWGTEISAYKTLSSIAVGGLPDIKTKRKMFVDDDPKYPIVITDRYITRTPTPTAYSISTNGADSWTLTNNNPLATTTTNLKFDGNCDQFIYQVGFPALNSNEWIKITNNTNNSELKITWLNGSPSSNPLVFNSYRPNKLYDAITGTEITPTAYSITQENRLYDLLYFNESMTNSVVNLYAKDNLTLQKNTGSTLTITLNNVTLFN